MKALLMHRDRDFDPAADQPPNAAELTQDLELDTLLDAMAAGDPFLLGVARSGVLASLHDPEAIVYRQRVLADCLRHPDVVRELYAIAEEAVLREKKIWAGVFGDRYPEGLLHRSVQVLQLFMGLIRRIRLIADVHRAQFESEGFAAFFGMIEHELDDTYLASIEKHLQAPGVPGGRADQRPARDRQQGHAVRPAQPPAPAAGLEGPDPPRPHRLRVAAARSRRGRRPGAGGAAGPGDQPGRHRARPVHRPHPQLLHDAAHRAGLLRRLPQPARPAGRDGRTDLLPRRVVGRARAVRPRAVRRVAGPDDGRPGRGERPGRRWEAPRDRHGRQPGRQVDIPAERRPGPADDPVRHVRGRGGLPRQTRPPASSRTSSARRTPP